MHILNHSNAPWSPTGYGTLTRLFAPRWQQLGHTVDISAFYGLQGAPLAIDGMRVLPAGIDPYGNDTLAADAAYVGADIVISNMDVWVLSPEMTSQFVWVPWFPVDHDPTPPRVLEFLKPAHTRLVYSKFGQATLKADGVDSVYMPCGVDTDIYKPLPAEERLQARIDADFPPGAFVVGIVAANKGTPSRKAFDQQIRAFAKFRESHPDAVLYLHTEMKGLRGEDVRRIVSLAGLKDGAVRHPSQYQYLRGLITWEQLNRLYNTFDVLLNATCGEGFGLTIIEAQAAGVPVIVTDFSSMPELVRAGWKVPYADKRYTQESYDVTPDVDAIVAAYKERGNQTLRDKARAGMVAEYSADVVTQMHWKPALETIAAQLAETKTAVSDRRKRVKVNA